MPSKQQEENFDRDNHDNNSFLLQDLLGDVLIGVGVTAAIAPTLTAIDKAMVQRSAGTHSFLESVQISLTGMAKHPIHYLKSPTFLWMWCTYAATYSTANCFHTLAQENKQRQQQQKQTGQTTTSTVSASSILYPSQSQQEQQQQRLTMDPAAFSLIMFLSTTAANSTAAMCKDRAYSRMFGTGVTGIPPMSYGLWICRDFTVIGSSFLLPPTVARYIDEYYNNGSTNNAAGQQHHNQAPSKRSMAIAQFVTPLTAQLIAGPLHYMGLDFANRTSPSLSWHDRWIHLKGGLSSVIPARMIRILPAYGVGGVWNQHGRQAWKEYVREPPQMQHNNNEHPNEFLITSPTQRPIAIQN